jgi:hypothetical protein
VIGKIFKVCNWLHLCRKWCMFVHAFNERGCRNCMVVGFKTTYIQSVPITINVVSSNPTQCEVYSIQHYAKKFVCDLRQVSGLYKNTFFRLQANQSLFLLLITDNTYWYQLYSHGFYLTRNQIQNLPHLRQSSSHQTKVICSYYDIPEKLLFRKEQQSLTPFM